eukprot:GEMP01047909.1.p1 GENE.GEMP01047909.1~~GEMP01047909.1.p1  ORF type:complete len:138 (+),score=25.67 GEMP01047909.1:45-458(+)
MSSPLCFIVVCLHCPSKKKTTAAKKNGVSFHFFLPILKNMSQNRVSVNFVNGEEIVSASFTILADLKKFVAGSHNRRASNVIVMDMNHSVLEDDNMPPPSNVIVVLQEMLDEGVENAFNTSLAENARCVLCNLFGHN